MDRAYLMVLVGPDTWRLIFKGKYDDCMAKAMGLADEESWMVVRSFREHFGKEVFTVTN